MLNGKKILFIGNGGVGKTQIIRNLIGHNFEMEYKPTTGLTYYQNDNYSFIDRSGQEIPFVISRDELNQLNDIDEIILCYPSNSYSLLFLNVWFTYIARLNKPYKIFFTKSDITVPNNIVYKRDKFFKKINVEKIMVSAKMSNLGV